MTTEAERIAEAWWSPYSRRSLAEEGLAALHAIVAIMLFNAGWDILAWIFATRAVLDSVGTVIFAYKAQKLRDPILKSRDRKPNHE